MKRVILIVLDSVGCGAAPDAALYGDEGSNTIHAVSLSPEFRMENMRRLGLMNIEGAEAGEKCESPLGSFGRLQELSSRQGYYYRSLGNSQELCQRIPCRPFLMDFPMR